MSSYAITVEGLWKEYLIGQRLRATSFREALTHTLSAPVRYAKSLATGRKRPNTAEESFWALQDMSFSVRHGEVLGIIGYNGAGKSTLLKVLSRITEPTRGRIRLHGRAGSLLEVGTGFHGDLTGRENILLNGAILGMKKVEIERKFDEIVAFAEVERFIDTPVKRYSSGMYLRLAFAVAAHLEPEILIVDEVLAVGDASFQRKCLGKMHDVSKAGRTVLFVSHNMNAIRTLCNRVMWLESGRIREQGDTHSVVSSYLDTITVAQPEAVWEDNDSAPTADHVRLHRVLVRACPSSADGIIRISDPFFIDFSYWNRKPGQRLSVAFNIYNIDDVCMFHGLSPSEPRPSGLITETCQVPGHLLNESTYWIEVIVMRERSAVLTVPTVCSFNVLEAESQASWHGRWPGVMRPDLQWDSKAAAASATLQ